MSESIQKIDGALWMLHRVAPDRPETVFQKVDQETRITPEYLEKLIVEAKEAGYRFLSLDQFLANKHAGKGSEKDIVVTIDDGYRDIYQYAWPIFEKHQVPFVFYVASDFIQFGFEHCKRPELDAASWRWILFIIIKTLKSAERNIRRRVWRKKQLVLMPCGKNSKESSVSNLGLQAGNCCKICCRDMRWILLNIRQNMFVLRKNCGK